MPTLHLAERKPEEHRDLLFPPAVYPLLLLDMAKPNLQVEDTMSFLPAALTGQNSREEAGAWTGRALTFSRELLWGIQPRMRLFSPSPQIGRAHV